MSTLLAQVHFCENNTYIKGCGPRGEMEGHALKTHGSHLALTLFIRLLGVDDPCLRQHMTIPFKTKTKNKKKNRSSLIIVVTTTAQQMPDRSENHSPKAKFFFIFTLVCFQLALFSGRDNSKKIYFIHTEITARKKKALQIRNNYTNRPIIKANSSETHRSPNQRLER